MKMKFIALAAILACLLIAIPTGFAADNETAVDVSDDCQDNISSTIPEDILMGNDYYFNASVEDDDGNGSADNPYKELTASRIKDNSVLHLSSGEYDFANSKTINNVTVIGQNVNSTVIKNAKFTVSSSFTLYNITLVSSTVTNNGNFAAVNAVFKDSSSSSYGAAINSKSNVFLDNCTFQNNSAKCGGAIYSKDGSLNIINSRFLENSATLFGGAILSISSNTTISDSRFRSNKADFYGGAIYTLYSPFNLTGSIFTGNRAFEGGALFIDNATYFSVENNQFADNFANDTAGAIYALSNNGSLADSNTFENNSAAFENDVHQSQTPNLVIGDGNYTLMNYNPDTGDLPSSYDLRNYGYVTPVKNQGSGGNCWAFAALAALESCILKATGIPYDLSEENMKNLMAKFSDYGWKYEPNTGGLDDMAVGYLISWLGPVNESEDRYDASLFLSPVLHSLTHVQNVLFITRNNLTDNDAIKRAIMEYGAVSTSIAWYGTYVKDRINYYCYSSSETANHAIAIVGWDDNYSKDNFRGNPQGDGAWIIKNSWGTGSGDRGYYYVSYYDLKIAEPGKRDATYTFIFNDTIKYDKNYQYDIPGKTDIFLNESSTVWYKNVFNATDNEYLTAVSTHFYKDTDYVLSVYVNNELKLVQEGFSGEGYFTIELNEFIPLALGDIFEVVFKVTVDGEASFPISEKITLKKTFYRENISFLSYDGVNWTDLYNLTWKYSSHTYNSQVACIKAFTILNLINTTTRLNITVTDTLNIEATVLNQYAKPVSHGSVTFTINGADYTLNLKNGKVLLQIPFIQGEYNITALYNPASGFISSKDNISVDYFTINTAIEFFIDNEFNPVNIVANVINQFGYPLDCGNVTFTVEGQNHTVDVFNGTAIFSHIFASEDLYDVSVRFNGFEYYAPSSYSGQIQVYLPTTDVNIFCDDAYNPYTFIAIVTDQMGNVIDSGEVVFTVEGENITALIINGSANITYSFANYGLNNISAYFERVGFKPSGIQIEIYTYIDNADIALNITKYDYLNAIIDIALSNEINETAYVSIANGLNVSFYEINLTDGKGQLELNDLAYGTYNVTVSVSSDMYYIEDANGTFSIDNLRTYISADNLEIYYDENMQYCAYLYDGDSMPLENKIITFSLNGMNVSKITDSNGMASFALDCEPGSYVIGVYFNGDEKYLMSNVTRNVKINSTLSLPETSKYAYNSKYVVKMLDSNGNPLANQEVSLKVGSNTHKIKTNENGEMIFAVNLDSGKYSFEITNSQTGEVKTQQITVVKRITENKDVTMYYSAGKYYKVKVVDDNGNIAKGLKVKFTINGKSYTKTTDSKGYASYKITQTVGKYTITAEYNGFKVSNKITVKSTIVTKNVSVKKGKTIIFTAKLLDKNGKLLKNKKVAFKFKGKTYKIKTNRKGVAILKINKKYKAGKYLIKTSYGKLTVLNTIKIK
jgi:predicted outer membrane repeat protein